MLRKNQTSEENARPEKLLSIEPFLLKRTGKRVEKQNESSDLYGYLCRVTRQQSEPVEQADKDPARSRPESANQERS